MPVAPSYQQNYDIIGEPFNKSGKLYIKIKHKNTHNVRDARWYSQEEYAKAYGGKSIEANKDRGFAGLRLARGFRDDYITVIRGATYDDEYLNNDPCAYYETDVGWYYPSYYADPINLPPHLIPLKLTWDEFKLDETHPKPAADLQHLIMQKLKEYTRA